MEKYNSITDCNSSHTLLKRKRKKSLKYFFRRLLVLVLCITIFYAVKIFAHGLMAGSDLLLREKINANSNDAVLNIKDIPNKEHVNPSEVTAAYKTESKSQKNERSDDWRLILLNKTNYLPDDFEVKLAKLRNGHAIDERVLDDLQEMMDDARAQGLSPLICSSYRTSEKQVYLFNRKVEKYKQQGYSQEEAKKKASVWVAIPGTSEHEAGLALDIVSADNQVLDKSQEDTPLQKWLIKNSYKYGFILRYPSNKSSITGIGYEPWHYRYVGKDAAAEITQGGLCLEEYLDIK